MAGETDWWDASGLFLYMFCTRNLGSILVRREVNSSPAEHRFKKYLIFIKKYNIIYIEKLRKINILPGGGMVDTPSFDLGYC